MTALVLSACGYSVRPEPNIRSVRIGMLDNKTHEPKLSDMLKDALARQLAAAGVQPEQGAEHLVSGVLHSLSIQPLAESGGITVKFKVTLKGKFMLTQEKGEPVALDTPSSFIVAFGSDVPLDTLYAMRAQAVARAVDDLAADIAADIAANAAGNR